MNRARCRRLAHRVISLPHGNSVAFGLKRTLGRILRVDGLVSRPPPRQAAAAGANVQRLRSFGVACWTWIYCEKCLHHAPMALVPLIIRWGANTSSDRLRQRGDRSAR